MTIDVLTFTRDREPLDVLLWRTYRREVPGLVEDTLSRNPGLADLGIFPPPGTTIDVLRPATTATAASIPLVRLY